MPDAGPGARSGCDRGNPAVQQNALAAGTQETGKIARRLPSNVCLSTFIEAKLTHSYKYVQYPTLTKNMRKTNGIGTGTANLAVNAPVDWRAELGRAAFAAGVSMGEFMRRLLIRGAEQHNPELAARLREIRRRYYGATLATVFVLGLFGCWASNDDQTIKRRVRRPREERVEVVTVRGAVEA